MKGLNRSYWPDAEATGQLLTELCEGLVDRFEVHVVAGQPLQNPTGVAFRRWGTERHKGVTIRRVWHTTLPKRWMIFRLVNLVTYLLGAAWAVVWSRRPDVVVVETDPPLLCLLGWLMQRRGARLVVYLQDIYPDLGVAIGKIPDAWWTGILRRWMFATYRRADRVVVLSRDMRRRILDGDVSLDKITCVPNWIDTSRLQPQKSGNPFRDEHLQSIDGTRPKPRVLVMYSGNMGLCQRLEDVLDAAERLKDHSEVSFLLVGDGASRRRLEADARRRGLDNVRFLPYQPIERLAESLSAADIHLVPLDPRVSDCLMPSKLYGILASATPVLAIASADCELAEIVRQHGIGRTAAPGDPDGIATAILEMVADHEHLRQMGQRARRLAEEQYDRRYATARFGRLLGEVLGLGDETGE